VRVESGQCVLWAVRRKIMQHVDVTDNEQVYLYFNLECIRICIRILYWRFPVCVWNLGSVLCGLFSAKLSSTLECLTNFEYIYVYVYTYILALVSVRVESGQCVLWAVERKTVQYIVQVTNNQRNTFIQESLQKVFFRVCVRASVCVCVTRYVVCVCDSYCASH